MSWGYGTGYNTVTSLNYRGTSYTDSNTTTNSNYRYTNYGLNSSSGAPSSTYVANVRVSSVDVDIEELITAGVIVCIAAGNRATKIDVSGGTDYNNFVVTDGGTIYYQRGSSPMSSNAIIVGSMDSTAYDATNDQRATYSETGPGVSMWAPGTDIMSATSNINKWGGGSQNYYLNSSYKQTNISGTSMATPQIAGVAALILQLNPTYTPAQIKTSLTNTAGSVIYSTGLTNDYSNTRSLLGSAQKVLYANYNVTTTTTSTSTTTSTTSTTTAAPTTTTTTTLGPGQTTTTSTTSTSTSTTSTTTTTTTEAPSCIDYRCLSGNGGYIFWTDCITGNQASSLINGGKIKYISSITYPIAERGSNTKITRIID
jgi:hypothetical protein